MKSIIFASFLLCLAGTATAQGWVQLTSGTPNRLQFISTVGSDTVFASGDELLRSTNGGASWEKLANPPMGINRVGIVRFLDGLHGWIGNGDSVWRTIDGGVTWIGSFTGSSRCDELIFSTLNSGCVMGNPNVRTTDGGVTWQPSNGTGFNCMAFSDATHGFVMGDAELPPPNLTPPPAAAFENTNDGGVTWNLTYAEPSKDGKHSGVPKNVLGLAAISTDTLIAVGESGLIAITRDAGIDWDTIYSGTDWEGFEGVCFPDKHNGYTVSYGGWILHTTDGGFTWAQQNSGVTTPLNTVSFIDSAIGYAVGNGGIILKTTNGGLSWVNIGPLSSNVIDGTVYPQPSNSETSLDYNLPEAQHVTLSIQNVTGVKMRDVLNEAFQPAGPQSISIDTKNLPCGTYFLHFQSEKYFFVVKLDVLCS